MAEEGEGRSHQHESGYETSAQHETDQMQVEGGKAERSDRGMLQKMQGLMD